MRIIHENDEIKNICNEIQKQKFVTIDTEFMRETTYWPILCLIQMATIKHEIIIDPIGKNINLAPLFQILQNPNIIKVFHAARQDIEIFKIKGNIIPTPIFDTQIAAMACGYGDTIGYENLAKIITGHKIDKSSRFTNWAQRPLSKEQLKYAIADVTILRDIYQKIKNELQTKKREHWLNEEVNILTNPQTYDTKPENAWKKVRFNGRGNQNFAIFVELCAWREKQAQKSNVPKGRIIKDDVINEIARRKPKSKNELSALRAIPKAIVNARAGQKIIEIVNQTLQKPENTLPKLPNANGKEKRTPQAGSVDMLKTALRIICEKEKITPRLVASTKDLENIALGEKKLSGWRANVFGEKAEKILMDNMQSDSKTENQSSSKSLSKNKYARKMSLLFPVRYLR